MKKTSISLVTFAVIITVLNQFIFPNFFDVEPNSSGTGLSILFLAAALLHHLREK
ncbi:hypothetical protein SAMN05444673_3924 [Bacillus sp. OV166]|uniref:hypothetical protein n=1 Tax=Bacillus sp. OV166 TaxID=1882763 RepID=UPI000A2AE0FB|nr:hypothetical protein [Bacillus sp. OV166]SMQ80578.1 hypothetical protein SAMN05444673_3924 [Bacillus sp. OV166]